MVAGAKVSYFYEFAYSLIFQRKDSPITGIISYLAVNKFLHEDHTAK